MTTVTTLASLKAALLVSRTAAATTAVVKKIARRRLSGVCKLPRTSGRLVCRQPWQQAARRSCAHPSVVFWVMSTQVRFHYCLFVSCQGNRSACNTSAALSRIAGYFSCGGDLGDVQAAQLPHHRLLHCCSAHCCFFLLPWSCLCGSPSCS